jgi:hypothetical protein
MINNTPLRLTTLHLAQRFLIDDVTLIRAFSFFLPFVPLWHGSQSFNYTGSLNFVQVFSGLMRESGSTDHFL